MQLNELTGEQRRQLIDSQQIYESWRLARQDRDRRFAGGMRWASRNGADYLLRKVGRSETSLGVRSPETEAAYDAFVSGRAHNRDRLVGLARRLDEMAPVNVAMELGRVPVIAARIMRACDERQLLGAHLVVVGTSAIFAYEAAAGVRVGSGLVATEDIDLLYDARRRIGLAFSDLQARGLIGLLQQIDASFAPVRPRAFRASNRDGFLVDLIRPEAKDVFRDRRRAALTDFPDDLEGAAIFGLDWLVNAPKLAAVAIDERGYPVPMVVIDPRIFALHKAWLSARPDREPVKAARDIAQARAAAAIATRYLRRAFDAPDLTALPKALRDLAPAVTAAEGPGVSPDRPNW